MAIRSNGIYHIRGVNTSVLDSERAQSMTIADREKLASLSANLWFDWLQTLDDDAFKQHLNWFDKISGGTLSACKTLLTAKTLLKEHNEQERKSL
jgi:hypothetical protein